METKTTFIILVLKVVYLVVFVFSIYNFFTNKNSQGRNLSANKISSKVQWPIIPIKNLTSLFLLIFLSKHISWYALGRLEWILDIIWLLNQHFKLKKQRNWLQQVSMLKFWSVNNCFLVHWTKKLTLPEIFSSSYGHALDHIIRPL